MVNVSHHAVTHILFSSWEISHGPFSILQKPSTGDSTRSDDAVFDDGSYRSPRLAPPATSLSDPPVFPPPSRCVTLSTAAVHTCPRMPLLHGNGCRRYPPILPMRSTGGRLNPSLGTSRSLLPWDAARNSAADTDSQMLD